LVNSRRLRLFFMAILLHEYSLNCLSHSGVHLKEMQLRFTTWAEVSCVQIVA